MMDGTKPFFKPSEPKYAVTYEPWKLIKVNRLAWAKIIIKYSHLLFCRTIVSYFYLVPSVT